MTKTIVTKYYYIEMLVKKIKENYGKSIDYNWYFDELIKLYAPLINSCAKKLYRKFKSKVKFSDVKSKVQHLFFEAIRRYDPKYSQGNNTKNFNYVYFSSYLKKYLPWELLRITKPVKIDYDDLVVDSRNIELEINFMKNKEVVKKLISKDSFTPISDNFIGLCRHAQKSLKNDLISDIMMLHFGYDYKNFEIAKILTLPEHKIGVSMLQLKAYWKNNKEIILP